MSLTVLKDDQIQHLLENLTRDELESFRDSLKSALHEYSTGTQTADAGEINQPPRTSIKSQMTGATTLFMPSSSADGLGLKVVTLTPPLQPGEKERRVIKPTGAITIFSKEGSPVGLLHASTLTAFRTALASVCLLVRRNSVKTITVFGSGEQAYWHVRLALILRGSTIRQVYFVNRRFGESCKLVLKRFFTTPTAIKEREGWAECQFSILTPGYGEYERLLKEHIRSSDVIFCCTPSTQPLFDHTILTNTEGRKKGRLIVAIGSYSHDMREIPVEVLKQATRIHEKGHHHFHKHALEGGVVIVDTLDGALKEAGEIIDAGLTPQQLVELGELVMLHRIHMKDEEEAIADDASSTTSGAPSLDFEQLKLTPGSSAMSSVMGSSDNGSQPSSHKRSDSASRKSSTFAFHRRSSSHASIDRRKKNEDHLVRWLQGGNVIYKSVGLGLMDLTVGLHLVNFAREKGVGSHIEGF